MNTIHNSSNHLSDQETETFSKENRLTRKLKLAAAACVFAVPTGMYADDVVSKVQESVVIHIDPEVLEGIPAK
jgi:hypothetical protein